MRPPSPASTTRSAARSGHRPRCSGPIRPSSSAAAADGSSASPPGRPTSSGSTRAWPPATSAPRFWRPPRPSTTTNGSSGSGEAAGDRFDDLELQCLTFLVQIVPNREEAVAQLAGMLSLTTDQVEGSPIAMIGSTDQIAETLRSGGSCSASPTSWSTRRRWRRSHRWWPHCPGPRGGGAGSPDRPLRRDLRPGPHRPSRGGRGGAHGPGARPDAPDGGQPALAEGGRTAADPGRGPVRHGRGRGRPGGPVSSPAGWRSTGVAPPTPSTPSASWSGTCPAPSWSWWSGRTWWPDSPPGRTSPPSVAWSPWPSSGARRPAGRPSAGMAGRHVPVGAVRRFEHRAAGTAGVGAAGGRAGAGRGNPLH